MAKPIKTARFPRLMLRILIEKPGSVSWEFAHIKGWIDSTDHSLLYPVRKAEGEHFCGVCFNAQTDRDFLARQDDPMYSYCPEWKYEKANLRSLKYGVAALTEIERKLATYTERFGEPASFGAWVQRLAEAIGLDKIKVSDGSPETPAEAAHRIDGIISGWQQTERARQGITKEKSLIES
jgi:hypothetical protein